MRGGAGERRPRQAGWLAIHAQQEQADKRKAGMNARGASLPRLGKSGVAGNQGWLFATTAGGRTRGFMACQPHNAVAAPPNLLAQLVRILQAPLVPQVGRFLLLLAPLLHAAETCGRRAGLRVAAAAGSGGRGGTVGGTAAAAGLGIDHIRARC